jgi:hypothetical protein
MNKKFIPCGADENLEGGHWVGQDDTVDQIASNLVREGINKHKARELAVHFIELVEQAKKPGWASVKNVTEYIDDLRGGADE